MMNEKEASERYGYSLAWFQKKRWKKEKPIFYKSGKKVMYPVKETDEFFKNI